MKSIVGFTVALAALLAVPGPTNTLLALSGATVGWYRSLPLLIGELIGYEASIALVRVLVVPLMQGQTRVLHGVAAVYLIGLAIALWRKRLDHSMRVVRVRQVLITTLLNPKALVIALVLIPASTSEIVLYWLVLSITIPIIGAGWLYAGRFVGRAMPRKLATAIPRVGSVVLGLFALVLVVSMVS